MIKELKAEIFDILMQQDQYKMAIAQLDELKNEKLKELQKAMQDEQKPVAE